MDIVLAGSWNSPIPASVTPGDYQAADYDGVLGTSRLAFPSSPFFVPLTEELWFVDRGSYSNLDSGNNTGALRKIGLRPDADPSGVYPVETVYEPDPPPAWTGATADYQRVVAAHYDQWDEVVLFYVQNVVDGANVTTATHEVWSCDPLTLDINVVVTNVFPLANMMVTSLDSGTKLFIGTRLGPGTFVTDTIVIYDDTWTLQGTWTPGLFSRIVGVSMAPGHGQFITRRGNTTLEVYPFTATSQADRLQQAVTSGGVGGFTGLADPSNNALLADQTNGRVICGPVTGNDNGGIMANRTASSPARAMALAIPYDPDTYFATPLADSFQCTAVSMDAQGAGGAGNFPSEQGVSPQVTRTGGYCWVPNGPLEPGILGSENALLANAYFVQHMISVFHRSGFASSPWLGIAPHIPDLAV